MAYLARKAAKGGRRSEGKARTFSFSGFAHGLNTSVPPFQIKKTELAECVNFKINPGGQLESRTPITAVTTTATTSNAAVKFLGEYPIAGTTYTLLIDANDKLYYNNSGTPTAIGTLEGAATLMAFKGVVLVMDGSYLKYLDGVAATNLKIAYDDGTGTTGYQFDNSDGDDDTSFALGNGTIERVAYKFTSQSWDSGYTIPPTTVTAKLQRALNGYTGVDNVDITCKIRKVSDDSVLATKTFISAPIQTNVSDTATEYSMTFESSDITNEMDPSTAYYCTLEYNNGDATNYVHVRCTTVSGGTTGYSYYDPGGGSQWNADATKNPIMALQPGRPPKASFGCVYDERPWIADPDNVGWIWYGNLTYLDWSTSSGGGYIGVVDDSSNTFAVGAMLDLFGDLYVYGKEDLPFLCRLTGSDPSDWALPKLYQRAWSTHKTLISATSDLWSASKDGVDPLSGIEEYGDVRTFSASDPVKDRIETYWNTANTIAGYHPPDGQFWLSFPTYHRVLIAHTKLTTGITGRSIRRYPWVEYELYRENLTSSTYKWTASGSGTNEYYCELAAGGDPSLLTPDYVVMDGTKRTEGTAGSLSDLQWDYADNDGLGYSTVYIADANGDPDSSGVEIYTGMIPQSFAVIDGVIHIGGSDGFVYKSDTSDYKDLSEIQVRPRLKTAYTELPYQYFELNKYQLVASSKAGGSIDVSIYKDGLQATAAMTTTHLLPVFDTLTLADMTMDLGDAVFALSSTNNPIWQSFVMNARSFQVEMSDVTIGGYPLYIDGIFLRYRQLEE